MTDLERFFRHLVRILAAADPGRLRQPIPLAEIRGSIMPYRTNRGPLQLETSEDYDLLLMRLCAGEGAFARTSPGEVGMRFEQELASSNPHLGMLRQFADSLVSLSPGKVTSIVARAADVDNTLEPVAGRITEPTPAVMNTPAPVPSRASTAVSRPPAPTEPAIEPPAGGVHCLACSEPLPDDFPVKFCPYCGTGQVPARCSACNAELKSGWRFCPGCGQGV